MAYHTKISCLIVLSSLALLCAGCGSLRAPADPYRIWTPKKNAAKTHKDMSQDVWKSIRAKKIDATKPLDVGALITITLRNSPLTREAWESARAAEAEVRQAQNEYNPKIALSAKATRDNQVVKATNVAVSGNHYKVFSRNDHSEYTPSADLTYLIFDFGGRNAAITEAEQTLLAKNFEFNQAILDQILIVETAYYELDSAYSALAAAKSDTEDTSMGYESAKQKFDVGLVSKLDVYQAKADYDDALYVQEEAHGNLNIAKGTLAEALGFPADTEFEIAEPPQEVPGDISIEDVSELIEKALQQRPDIMAARANLRAKDAALREAVSDLWPTVNFGASAGVTWYDYYPSTNANVTLRNQRSSSYEGYLSVNWDLFDGLVNINKKIEAEHLLSMERAQLEQEELEATQDIWTKYYAYKTAGKKMKFSKSFFESAKTSYDLALIGYKEGLKDILDLLDSQSKLSEARSRLIETKKDLFVSLAELVHATGLLYINTEG